MTSEKEGENFNDNEKEIKRGKLGHNQAMKFDFICKAMCHSFNTETLRATLDLKLEVSTWTHGEFSPDFYGMMKKSKVN